MHGTKTRKYYEQKDFERNTVHLNHLHSKFQEVYNLLPMLTLFPLSPLRVSAKELSGNVHRPLGIP